MIKFRVYKKDKKCFYYSNHTIGIDDTNKQICGDAEIFTGLNDTNGKEIYEGDICEILFDTSLVEDWVYLSLTEKEKNEGRKTFIVESPIFNSQTEFSADKIKIIGNIWES